MVCRSVPSASLFHHFYELRINFGGGEARNPTPPSPEIQTALDLMHVVSKHRILRQHPVAVVASRFPTALSAVEKKKRPIKLPRVYIPAFYPTTYCARKEQNQNYINDIPLKSKNIHEGEGKKGKRNLPVNLLPSILR